MKRVPKINIINSFLGITIFEKLSFKNINNKPIKNNTYLTVNPPKSSNNQPDPPPIISINIICKYSNSIMSTH